MATLGDVKNAARDALDGMYRGEPLSVMIPKALEVRKPQDHVGKYARLRL